MVVLVLVLVDDEVEVDVELDDEVLRWYTRKRWRRPEGAEGVRKRRLP